MPELPEVETICRQLATRLTGRRITNVEMIEPFMLRDTTAQDMRQSLPGRQVEELSRHGKFLIVTLDGDAYLTLHLGMTGQLLILSGTGALPSHARFVFGLDSGKRLVFRDIRKFGRVHLTLGTPAPRLRSLGPDALRGTWDTQYLASRLRGRKTSLKAFLLSQEHLAGIGNIYADEIMFAAGLAPGRRAASLSVEEIELLVQEIRAGLAEGVRLRGCSISDFVDTEGKAGRFQEALRVYGRAGKSCARCGTLLERTVIAGRGTTSCPICQL